MAPRIPTRKRKPLISHRSPEEEVLFQEALAEYKRQTAPDKGKGGGRGRPKGTKNNSIVIGKKTLFNDDF